MKRLPELLLLLLQLKNTKFHENVPIFSFYQLLWLLCLLLWLLLCILYTTYVFMCWAFVGLKREHKTDWGILCKREVNKRPRNERNEIVMKKLTAIRPNNMPENCTKQYSQWKIVWARWIEEKQERWRCRWKLYGTNICWLEDVWVCVYMLLECSRAYTVSTLYILMLILCFLNSKNI